MANEQYQISLRRLGKSPEAIRATIADLSDPKEVGLKIAEALDAEPYIDYADIIRVVVKSPSAGGFDENELRKSVSILNEVARAEASREAWGSGNPILTLTPPLYAFLIARLTLFRWRTPHPHIVQFCDDVRGATKFDLDVIAEAKPEAVQ